MQGFSLDISGVKQIENAIKRMDKQLTDGMSKEINASMQTIRTSAVRKTPVNLGRLRGSIKVDIRNTLFKSVFTEVKYAPYIEFGTKKNVRIPAGYEAFAAQFKGKAGGTITQFYEDIKAWVGQKKIDPKLTYVIFRAILRNGIKPQPFLIPAYEEEKPKLIKRLRNLFK